MQEVKLIPATVADIEEISAMAREIWYQFYPEIISTNQIEYMLELMYSRASLEEQINIKNHKFCFISSNAVNVGFLSYHLEKGDEWFINKFYINRHHAFAGIGSQAFRLLLLRIHAGSIRLTVNRQNIRSINFYFKNGFRIERAADFDIGNSYEMNDFVMLWEKDTLKF